MRKLHFLIPVLLIIPLGFITGCSKGTSKNPDLSDAENVPQAPRYLPVFPTPDAPKGYLSAGTPGFSEAEYLANESERHPLPQNSEQRKKIYDDRLKAQRALTVELFEKFGKTKESWAPQAREVLDRIAKSNATIPVRRLESEDEIRELLAAAIQAGCDDPQIRFYSLSKNLPDAKGLEKFAEEMDKLGEQFDREKYPITRRFHPKWFACVARGQMLINDKTAHLTRAALEDPTVAKRIIDCVKYYDSIWPLLTEFASAQSYENDKMMLLRADELMKEFVRSGHDRKEAFDKIDRCLAAGPSSKWLRKTVEGRFLIDYAWDARGFKLARYVKDEAFAIFHDRLKEAEKALTEAWESEPMRTEPATMMITVCMGSSEPRETMEFWFKRALEADPDNLIACEHKIQFLLPKWGGSFLKASTFAKQCARTKNWYAKLPGLYCLLLLDNSRLDLIDLSPPEIWQDIREIFEPHLVEEPTDRYALSIYARMACIKEDYDLAHYLFLKIDRKPILNNYSFSSMADFSLLAEKARVNFLQDAVMKEQGTYKPQKTQKTSKSKRP